MIYYTFEVQTKDRNLKLLANIVTVHTDDNGYGLYYGPSDFVLVHPKLQPKEWQIREWARSVVIDAWNRRFQFDVDCPTFHLVNLKTSKTKFRKETKVQR